MATGHLVRLLWTNGRVNQLDSRYDRIMRLLVTLTKLVVLINTRWLNISIYAFVDFVVLFLIHISLCSQCVWLHRDKKFGGDIDKASFSTCHLGFLFGWLSNGLSKVTISNVNVLSDIRNGFKTCHILDNDDINCIIANITVF